MAQIEVTVAEAYDLCMDIFKARLVPNLISSPGLGKSSLARQIADDNNLLLIDVRLSQADPTDLNGFPTILNLDKLEERVKAGYVPMDTFPIEGDELPINPKTGKKYAGWLILLDEFPSAPLSVQAAAYKVVLDKMIGNYHLHKRVLMMTAGNKKEDKAIVNRLGTAMQSRIIHLMLKSSYKSWAFWADANNIDHRIRSFIAFKPELLHRFDPNHTDLTFPCPRTWEFLSKIIKAWTDIPMKKLAVIAGTVGDGAAREFYSYSKIYRDIPTIGEILRDPENCRMGTDPSMQFAMAGLASHHMKAENADTLIKFIARMGIDFQVVALRTAILNDPDVKRQAGVRKWISRNSHDYLRGNQ